MKTLWTDFWKWYEKHLTLNIGIAAFLFTLQLIHLYWLTAHVVALKLTGTSYFELTGLWEWLILIVDYTEIPALITTSLVYINEYRQKKNYKSLLYLFFLNSQWLHIFWITDEFVVDQFSGNTTGTVLPAWLAWIAIGIDYLELPVIYDTIKKLITALRTGKAEKIKEAFEED